MEGQQVSFEETNRGCDLEILEQCAKHMTEIPGHPTRKTLVLL